MSWLEGLFLGAFAFGLLLSVGSVLLGGHVGPGRHGWHLPAPHGGHGFHLPELHFGHGAHFAHGGGGHGVPAGSAHAVAGSAGQQRGSESPFNLTALTAFVAWFGGVGYLAVISWEAAAWVALVLALLAGAFGYGVVYLFFTRLLLRAERWMDPADYCLEGTVARVTTPIGPGRIGEIQYVQGGARRSEGARGLGEAAIERDAEVVIVRYERGIAYVEPWESFVNGPAMQSADEGR